MSLSKNKLKSLTKLETQFFAWIQAYKIRQITSGEVSRSLGIARQQENKLLSNLSVKGLITRVKKGLYLVPAKVPLGGLWQADELTTIKILMEERRALYQLSGHFAFHYHGLIEQIPNNFFIYNDKISITKKINGITYTFTKVSPERLGGTQKITNNDILISSFERTISDAIYDYKRFNTIPKVFDWIKSLNDKKIIKELIRCSLAYGNASTCKRLGYLLEQLSFSDYYLKQLHQNINNKSLIAFDPSKRSQGKVNKKWGLIINNKNYA